MLFTLTFNIGSRVIFFSSSTTKVSSVRPPYLLYTASKGAIEQITRVLAKDLGARNVTVNAIAPSATDTDMFRDATARSSNANLAAEISNLHPQKRIGRADEISPVAAFLARDEASWVNGQTLFVNGVSIHHAHFVCLDLFDLIGVCRIKL